MTIKDLLQKIDLLGNRFSFEINSSKTQKTAIFGVFSILLYISSFILAFMFGKEVYERKLPSVYLMNERVKKSEVFLRNFPLFFKFCWVNGTLLSNLEDYFDFQITNMHFDDNYNITYEFLQPTTNCSSSLFSSSNPELLNKILSKNEEYMCVDTTKNNTNSSFYNGFSDYNSANVKFEVFRCNPKVRKCAENIESLMKEIYVVPTFINSYVDSSNYTNPVQYYISSFAIQTTDEISKFITLYFEKSLYSSDNGFLLEDIYTDVFVMLKTMLTDVNSNKIGDKIKMLHFNLACPNIRSVIKRNYLKIQDLIAKVGGLVKGLLLIVSVLTFNYNSFLYNTSIYRILKKRFGIEKDKKDNEISHNNYLKATKTIEKTSKTSKIQENNIKKQEDFENISDDNSKKQINNLNEAIKLSMTSIKNIEFDYEIDYVDFIKGTVFGFLYKKKREECKRIMKTIEKGVNFENLIRINFKNYDYLDKSEQG